MSWTSESEPESELVDNAANEEFTGDEFGDPVDVEDDRIDPSMFFGLFDDLDPVGGRDLSDDEGQDEPTSDKGPSDPVAPTQAATVAMTAEGGERADGGDGSELFLILEELLDPGTPDPTTSAEQSPTAAAATDAAVVPAGDSTDETADTTNETPADADDHPEAEADPVLADDESNDRDPDNNEPAGDTQRDGHGWYQEDGRAQEAQPSVSRPEQAIFTQRAFDPSVIDQAAVETENFFGSPSALERVASPPTVTSPEDKPKTLAADAPNLQPEEHDRSRGANLGFVLAGVLLALMVGLLGAVALIGDESDDETAVFSDGTAPAAEAKVEDQQAASQGDGTANQGASANQGDDAVAGTNPDGDSAADQPGDTPDDGAVAEAMAQAMNSSRLDLTSIAFAPGTTQLDDANSRLMEDLAVALVETDQPVTITVRTYSEQNPADNQTLSEQQAGALAALLTSDGVAPERIRTMGLGSGPLTPAQPVPDFVVVNPELGDAVFKQVMGDIGPFSIGSVPGVGEVLDPSRLESMAPVAGIGKALFSFQDSTIGLAAYSYSEADNEANRRRAAAVAGAVAERVETQHGIDPDRITVITPGAAPYVVPASVGNHIWIQAGTDVASAFAVAGTDTATIQFEPGQTTLTPGALSTLTQLASDMAGSTDILVIDVRTYSEESAEANMSLSRAQAEAIADQLTAAGVESGRVRFFGSGASSYFPDDGGSTVTLTVLASS